MYIAIEASTAIVETIILSIYLQGLYRTYVRQPLFTYTAYAVFCLMLAGLSISPIDPFLRLGIGFLTFFIMARLLFGAKWLSALFSAILLTAIYIIVDIVASGIFGAFGVPEETLLVYGNSRVLFIVLGELGHIFCVFLVIKLSKWRRAQDSLTNAIPLLLCQVFSIFICDVMFLGSLKTATEVTPSFVIGAVGILYINIVIFLYVERVKEVGEIKKQNELAEQQYNSKLEYFEQVKDDQEMTRALWHDIKKYLNTMNELMNQNEIEHAKECITQVTDLFGNIGNVVDVGNTVVSAVLNHSVQKARRLDIVTELDIRVQPDMNISSADLSVIMGNTFDNAIEACGRLTGDKRKISCQMVQKNRILFYEIKNPFVKEDTPKADQKLHGFGLKNVKRSIDKYKGTMIIDSAGDEFKVTVHINIPVESAKVQLVS